MTLVTNVKGYINGDEWGIVEPEHLMSIQELIILGGGNGTEDPRYFLPTGDNLTSVLNELNSHGEEYFEKYNSEGLLYTIPNIGMANGLLNSNSSGSTHTFIGYIGTPISWRTGVAGK